MTEFSQVQSRDGKFDIELEYSEGKPSRLLITAYDDESSIYDLADAIFNYCCGGDNNSLQIGEAEIPCEVLHKGCRICISITNQNSLDDVLAEIAPQIKITV